MGPARVIPSVRLVLLRHGETDWNSEGRLQGQQDIPLNSRGREQAARAGKTIKKLLPRLGLAEHAPAFVASPLGRTRETMEIARRAMQVDPAAYAVDPRLMELSFGKWEGLTWPDVQALAPDLAAARETHKWSFVPPGGESYAMLAERVIPWLEDLKQDTVAMAHGGIARVLMAIIGGLPTERAPMMDIWQDRPLIFANGRFDWV